MEEKSKKKKIVETISIIVAVALLLCLAAPVFMFIYWAGSQLVPALLNIPSIRKTSDDITGEWLEPVSSKFLAYYDGAVYYCDDGMSNFILKRADSEGCENIAKFNLDYAMPYGSLDVDVIDENNFVVGGDWSIVLYNAEEKSNTAVADGHLLYARDGLIYYYTSSVAGNRKKTLCAYSVESGETEEILDIGDGLISCFDGVVVYFTGKDNDTEIHYFSLEEREYVEELEKIEWLAFDGLAINDGWTYNDDYLWNEDYVVRGTGETVEVYSRESGECKIIFERDVSASSYFITDDALYFSYDIHQTDEERTYKYTFATEELELIKKEYYSDMAMLEEGKLYVREPSDLRIKVIKVK